MNVAHEYLGCLLLQIHKDHVISVPSASLIRNKEICFRTTRMSVFRLAKTAEKVHNATLDLLVRAGPTIRAARNIQPNTLLARFLNSRMPYFV